MMRNAAVAGLLLLLLSPIAYAHCDNPWDDQERAACLSADLRQSDAQINKTYEELLATFNETGKAKLRYEQLAWLKKRDKVCQLDSHEKNREKWFQNLLEDHQKAVCVVRMTILRQRELKPTHPSLASVDPMKLPMKSSGLVKSAAVMPMSLQSDAYDVFGRLPRITGKWYLEVRLDVAQIARFAETALFVGVKSNDSGSIGKLLRIRNKDSSAEPQVLGIAVDLDNGKLYIRENGAWPRGEPGSSGGLDIKLGRNYTAIISSSTLLSAPLRNNFIDINFGEHAFTYALPDGYSPYQAPN